MNMSIWEIQIILDIFRNELEAREKIVVDQKISEIDDFKPVSGSALFSSGFDKKNFRGEKNFKFEKGQTKIPQEKKFNNSAKFHNNDQKFRCIFCRRNHSSSSCNIVTKPEIRKNIIKTEKCCFKCLNPGHLISECRSNFVFFKCGDHHIAIFNSTKKFGNKNDFKNQEEENQGNISSTSMHVFKNDSVLLQTARADVFTTNEKNTKNLRFLFDSGG